MRAHRAATQDLLLTPQVGNIPLRQRYTFGNKNRESMRWGKLIVADHRETPIFAGPVLGEQTNRSPTGAEVRVNTISTVPSVFNACGDHPTAIASAATARIMPSTSRPLLRVVLRVRRGAHNGPAVLAVEREWWKARPHWPASSTAEPNPPISEASSTVRTKPHSSIALHIVW